MVVAEEVRRNESGAVSIGGVTIDVGLVKNKFDNSLGFNNGKSNNNSGGSELFELWEFGELAGEAVTDINVGLSSEGAKSRLKIYGPNDVTICPKKSVGGRRVMISSRFQRVAIILGILGGIWQKLQTEFITKYFEQFRNPLIILLLTSAGVSLVLGQVENCISITLAVILVVTVAFIQEYRTERSLEALNNLAPPRCKVLRDGKVIEILAADLVPGDVVELHTGDRVPADIRLFHSVDLEMDESMLTGETEGCKKQAIQSDFDSIKGHPDDSLLEPSSDMALMATLVRQGYGRGIVVTTGRKTRLGKMYTLMRETEEKKSPLQNHLDRLGQQLSLYSLIIIGILAIIGLLQRQSVLKIFTVSVSLAVAAIPEGLPIVATITLALGVLRLSKKNVIVRKLPAVEALGSVNVLCVDKTGTITKNELSVQSIILCHDEKVMVELSLPLKELSLEAESLLTAIDLCNNAQKGIDGWHGNAIDVALRRFLDSDYHYDNTIGTFGYKLPTKRENYQRVEEVSFTSSRKFMAVKYINNGGEYYYCVKGAPEVIIPMTVDKSSIYEQAEVLYSRGLRVIAVAAGSNPKNLNVLGLIGMCDPPRQDMALTLDRIRKCGVRCIMVTGDSKQTALSIANQVGWKYGTVEGEKVWSGESLPLKISKGELDQLSIVYRASPEQKLALVDGLQKQGHVVAMTGDGVNDAPALKMADIGVAMGLGGTDVARAAAQIILTDDRLESLVDGIEEGKVIFSNIRHFIRFQLSTSLAALTLIAVSMIFTRDGILPMNAMQILLVNIIMDGPPAQSLGVEPVDPTALSRPPRPKTTPILNRGLLIRTGLTTLYIVLGTLMVLYWERGSFGIDSTRTFTVFVLFSMVNAYTCRSTYRSILTLGLFTNPFLTITSFLSILLLITIIYVPMVSDIFQTSQLNIYDWLIVGSIAISLLGMDELLKALIIRPKLSYKKMGAFGNGGSEGREEEGEREREDDKVPLILLTTVQAHSP